MQTPNSSSTPYLSVDEFINRHDLRAAGMLSVDDGSQPNQGQLESNANLAALLLSASGELEAACLGSERYSVADLQAANGASLAFMQDVVGALAYYKLFCRRGAPTPPETVVQQHEWAQGCLEDLRTGKRILAFLEVEEAGVPSDQFMSNYNIQNQNLLSTNCSRSLGVRNAFRRWF